MTGLVALVTSGRPGSIGLGSASRCGKRSHLISQTLPMWSKVQTHRAPIPRRGHSMIRFQDQCLSVFGTAAGLIGRLGFAFRLQRGQEDIVDLPDDVATYHVRDRPVLLIFGNRLFLHSIGFYELHLTKGWRLIAADLPKLYSHTGCVLSETQALLFGGQWQGLTPSNELHLIDFCGNDSILSHEMVPKSENRPSPRYLHTANLWGQKQLLIYGGRDRENVFDDFWSFDLTTQCWSQIEHLKGENKGPGARAGHCAILRQDCIYLCGGWNGEMNENGEETGACSMEVFRFDLKENSWFTFSLGPVFPTSRDLHAACDFSNDFFIIHGGTDADWEYLGDVWIFNYDRIPSLQQLAQSVTRKYLAKCPIYRNNDRDLISMSENYDELL